MVNLGNRIINEDGTVVLNDDGILEALFSDSVLSDNVTITKSNEIEQYNQWAKIFGLKEFNFLKIADINHNEKQNKWLIPQEFLDFDIEQYIISLCQTKEQLKRIELELELYKERNLFPLLKFITYIIEVMRNNNIIWGIGRGSSVSSYVLYLLGLHKVDSLRFDLDIKEFLK